jgi:hypothetical protein
MLTDNPRAKAQGNSYEMSVKGDRKGRPYINYSCLTCISVFGGSGALSVLINIP